MDRFAKICAAAASAEPTICKVKDKYPSEQPNKNLMVIEQVEGVIKVVLGLLGQLKATTPRQNSDKEGCIWTLEGWQKHNLRHLRNVFE